MIYYSGDIHGSTIEIVTFCERFKVTKEDTIVILGDVGANYFGNERDVAFKAAFAKLQPTILCIHGNHEIRPQNIPTYRTKEWNGGTVWRVVTVGGRMSNPLTKSNVTLNSRSKKRILT